MHSLGRLRSPEFVNVGHIRPDVVAFCAEIVQAFEKSQRPLSRVGEVLDKAVVMEELCQRLTGAWVERRSVLLRTVAVNQIVATRRGNKVRVSAVVAVPQLRAVIHNRIINYQQTLCVGCLDEIL